jgi:type IV pilus assembly protein PilB
VQAALTSHKADSALHAGDAPSAVLRLFKQGLEPFPVSSSSSSTVVGIMAQRLVRRICPNCIDEFVLTDRTAQATGLIT